MTTMLTRSWKGLAIMGFALLAVAGCGPSGVSSLLSGSKGTDVDTKSGRTFFIKPGTNATKDMEVAMVQLLPGDTLQFDCGYFELSATLLLSHTEDVLVKGCGKDKTVLSFKNSNTPEGILAVNVRGLRIQDLTVLDTGGNGIEFRAVDHGTVQRVRTLWSSGGGRESPTPITAANYASKLHVPCTDPATLDPGSPENQYPGADTTSPDYTVSPKSGRYGIYPVSSENILIEEAESIGASDAGIYVGQTNTAIIRKSRAAFNVFGFEIENVRRGEYDSNIAECNTGGFLVYDLDNLRQYGYASVMKKNISRMNNTYNFTSGGFVGNVPPGSGMITLSYDRIDIRDNEFRDNNTAGIIHASYDLFPEGAGRPTERRIDWYSEGVRIYRNKFVNNGNGLPLATTKSLDPNGDLDPSDAEVAKLLPALVGLKNAAACLNPANLATCATVSAAHAKPGLSLVGFRGAHIVWDGLLDSYNAACEYPKYEDGNRIPEDPDLKGKPRYTNVDPEKEPSCRYNKYKFDTTKAGNPRIKPEWFASCIDADNEFSADSLPFANFNGLKGLEPVIALAVTGDPAAVLAALPSTDLQNFASSFDRAPHQCDTAYGRNLVPLDDVVIPKFEPSGDYDPAPSAAQINALCSASVAPGAVNFGAAKVNCPTLDQYHLFSNPEDPTSAPNGGGVPFSMNTKLFSDYSVKYRVAYLPTGTKAVYNDKSSNGVNATVVFPVGTIIAKTFAFRDKVKNTETVVETRLLIKRVNSKGNIARWDGLPYIWSTDLVTGKRVAKLTMEGGVADVSWDMLDADSGQPHKGQTAYSIPNASQCLSCHSNEDKEPGSAPLGPKIRNLNGPYRSESDTVTGQSQHAVAGKNQVKFWCDNGLMSGCPTMTLDASRQIVTDLERLPIFNKTGDGTLEQRARAYLEVNCQHCHNDRGYAASTGLYLDSFRKVNATYGVCKTTTATGAEGRGGHTYDIVPGSGADSIIVFRTGAGANTPAARMPPIARSVHHDEGNALLDSWITTVVNKSYENGACGVN